MPEPRPIKYVLHVQNPYNMNEFDDFESDQPFQAFSVGDRLTRGMMSASGRVPKEEIPPVVVVAVHRAVVTFKDSAYCDETWVVTDQDWHQRHPAF